MNKLFDKVRMFKPKLNKFDLSHERKFSFNMGDLIPIMVADVVPGDVFRVKSEVMMRLAPMLAPIMHRVDVYTHYFYVPHRIIWNEFEDFITGGQDGMSEPIVPFVPVSGQAGPLIAPGSLFDYMGLPATPAGAITNSFDFSLLPFRAYQKIYNDYYRDPNLSTPVPFGLGSGNQDGDAPELLTLRKRAWEKDYFTSALPFSQRGGVVGVPVEGTVGTAGMQTGDIRKVAGGSLASTGPLSSTAGLEQVNGSEQVYHDIIGEGTLDTATITINLLRRAVKLQEWLEKNARGGYRYIEQMLSHFGVVSSDARLQRPEYLGGGKNHVVISEVLSTFQDDAGAIPQGSMAGHGISVGNTNGFRRRFEEHGYVIGIVSVLPRTAYQQGVPKHFLRMDKFDWYWPEFSQLGEQEVKLAELYHDYQGVQGVSDAAFGYQSRYCDYKYMQSSVHGDFRGSLAYWHMGRVFDAAPLLNTEFVNSSPTHRIFAVTDPAFHKLYCQLYNRVDALRPMPYFNVPSI